MDTIHKCSKEEKIVSMAKSIDKLNKNMFEDANGGSVLSLTKTTIENQKHMDDKLWMLDSNILALMKFQVKVETERDIKSKIKAKKEQRLMWAISLLAGTVVALLGILAAA